MVGLRQMIDIGFMSGVSNIVFWLKQRGIEPEEKLVDEIFRAAKQHNRVLSEEEVEEIIKYHELEKEPTLDTLSQWDKEIKSNKKKGKKKK